MREQWRQEYQRVFYPLVQPDGLYPGEHRRSGGRKDLSHLADETDAVGQCLVTDHDRASRCFPHDFVG